MAVNDVQPDEGVTLEAEAGMVSSRSAEHPCRASFSNVVAEAGRSSRFSHHVGNGIAATAITATTGDDGHFSEIDIGQLAGGGRAVFITPHHAAETAQVVAVHLAGERQSGVAVQVAGHEQGQVAGRMEHHRTARIENQRSALRAPDAVLGKGHEAIGGILGERTCAETCPVLHGRVRVDRQRRSLPRRPVHAIDARGSDRLTTGVSDRIGEDSRGGATTEQHRGSKRWTTVGQSGKADSIALQLGLTMSALQHAGISSAGSQSANRP